MTLAAAFAEALMEKSAVAEDGVSNNALLDLLTHIRIRIFANSKFSFVLVGHVMALVFFLQDYFYFLAEFLVRFYQWA